VAGSAENVKFNFLQIGDGQMSLLSLASGQSAYRGYEYFRDKKIIQMEQISDTCYTGIVIGSNGVQYEVTIDTEHPRKSQCSCPHADGRRIICKHMIALYFTAYPQEGKQYISDMEAYWEENEREAERIAEELPAAIHRMKKAELEEVLCQILFEGPDWQYERFVDQYIR
jgi:hypothetical protein